VPSPSGDKQLLTASIEFAGPAQLAALQRDGRVWVRGVAAAEDRRRRHAEDDQVVCRSELGEILRRFVADWRRTRPGGVAGQFGVNGQRKEVAPLGAVAWLSAAAGVPRGSLENLLRPAGRRSATVSLDLADRVLVALGEMHALHDGRVPVRTRDSAASCCSGSRDTTGRTTTATS
jgi:hypothetical protein